MPMTQAERVKKYKATAKGKAAQKRYHQSAKGKAARARYYKSLKGQAASKRSASKRFFVRIGGKTYAFPIRPENREALAAKIAEFSKQQREARSGRID